MRPTPAACTGRIHPFLLLLVCSTAALSCRDGAVDPSGVRSITVTAPATDLRPGFAMQAVASPLDASGLEIPGQAVVWRTLTPRTLTVTPEGILFALAPGVGVARASVGTISAELHLTLTNPPIFALSLTLDTLQLSLPGGVQTLIPDARDAAGIPILGATLEWESTASRIATVSSRGQVNAVAVGATRAFVRGDGIETSVAVIVDAPPTPTSPVISAVLPVIALPGQTLVVNGSGFASTPAGNTVLIDGTRIPVTAANASQLVLTLPAASSFACESRRVVALQVGTSGGIGVSPVTLQVVTPRELLPGQSLVLTTASDARCVELVPAAGRYVLTVPNGARALGAGSAAFSVVGSATAMPGVPLMVPPAATVPSAPRAWDIAGRTIRSARTMRAPPVARRGDVAHARLLEANLATLVRGRPSLALPRVAARPSATAAAHVRLVALQVPVVGTIVPLRVPRLGQPGFCDEFTPIGARTVFVGDHIVLLEDSLTALDGSPTLAGQMDDLLAQVGQELEATVWPLLQAFGNPLVMDGRLDDNGRLIIVLTPRINQVLGGSVMAAAVSCDFYPRAQFASSNVGEYVYAQVPTSAAAGFAPGTRARWSHEVRATLAHELKHVVSFAERIVRAQPLEESWLEEATARQAEELFTRAIFGTLRGANHGFGATLACELSAGDPLVPTCAGTPRAMQPHFEALWSYLDAPAARSPLGPTSTGDFSFYGSGWAFTRWLLDQEGVPEAAFFTGLTTSGLSGLANLEARSGRSWEVMLTEWSLAVATDDRAGLTTADSRLRFPSWDLRSVFQGFCDALGTCTDPGGGLGYPRANPLRPVIVDAGPFTVEMPAVVPGGFAAIELSGSAALRQIIELRGFRGAALPATVRLGILRVE